jgi:D-beta-D-heptose 7-phosphate kinase / D-beta-D-heptose 1-phosphate adenosyltransferase
VTRLLVVGDALLDRDVLGRVERICPDAPVPVLDVETVHERPGGAGLAALLAAQTGADVTLATAIGTDRSGRRLRALLESKVSVYDVLPAQRTVAKSRIRSQGQSLLRVDDTGERLDAAAPAEGSGAYGDAADIDLASFRALVLDHDAVLVADYGGAVAGHDAVRRVLEHCAATVPVVWDPHPRGDPPPAGTAVVTPNRREAVSVLDAEPGASPATLADRLRNRWRARSVVVTDGAEGVGVAEPDGAVDLPAYRCHGPVDPCGAGDRFAVEVALRLAAGDATRQAVELAVEAAGRWLDAGGVRSLQLNDGAAPAKPADRSGGHRPSADEVVDRMRSRGGVVVATGGCFDVLHAGHLQTLEQARSFGDCLVVLLNSDAGVRRLKGSGRPVHGAADRMRLLEALRCVDAVEVFEDDDPQDTLMRLRPDVWVKGGDYVADQLPESRVVRAYGGVVRIVPTLPGRSTSLAIKQLSRPGWLRR